MPVLEIARGMKASMWIPTPEKQNLGNRCVLNPSTKNYEMVSNVTGKASLKRRGRLLSCRLQSANKEPIDLLLALDLFRKEAKAVVPVPKIPCGMIASKSGN